MPIPDVTLIPKLSFWPLIKLFQEYEKQFGRRPEAVRITWEQRMALRADPEVRKYALYARDEVFDSIDGVKLEVYAPETRSD